MYFILLFAFSSTVCFSTPQSWKWKIYYCIMTESSHFQKPLNVSLNTTKGFLAHVIWLASLACNFFWISF